MLLPCKFLTSAAQATPEDLAGQEAGDPGQKLGKSEAVRQFCHIGGGLSAI